jgi:hypothetical protein
MLINVAGRWSDWLLNDTVCKTGCKGCILHKETHCYWLQTSAQFDVS